MSCQAFFYSAKVKHLRTMPMFIHISEKMCYLCRYLVENSVQTEKLKKSAL